MRTHTIYKAMPYLIQCGISTACAPQAVLVVRRNQVDSPADQQSFSNPAYDVGTNFNYAAGGGGGGGDPFYAVPAAQQNEMQASSGYMDVQGYDLCMPYP